jgi:hypothetical protein
VGVEEVFVVALHSFDGGVDYFERLAAQRGRGGGNSINGVLARGGVANDAAFAYGFATGLELGLDEQDEVSLPRSLLASESGEYGRKDKGGGDERDVHGDQLNMFGERGGFKQASVGSLHQGDARISAEPFGDLAVAGVDGEDGGCAALKHAVGEAASRGSDVQAGEAIGFQAPVIKGTLKLEAAAGDVLEVLAEHADAGGVGDGSSGLVDALVVNQDAPGKDKRLGALTGGREGQIDEVFIEAFFQSERVSGQRFTLHARRPLDWLRAC